MSRRVAVVAPTMFSADYGGATRIIEHLKALSACGFCAEMYTYSVQGALDKELSVKAHVLPIVPRFYQGGMLDRIYLDLQLILKKILSSNFRPTFIVSYNQEAGFISELTNFFGSPIVMDVQGVLWEEFVQHERHRELGKIVSLFERKSFELPSLIMVSNPFLADFIVHEFDIDRNKVETVLDNADTNLFMPRRKEDPIVDSVRSSLRIPKGIRICLYVGSFSKLQGIDVLLQAIKCVLENDDDLLFVLAGGRWSKDYLSYVQISRRLGISSHVRFIPGVSYVKILPYLLNLADIAVAPKRFSLQSHGKLAVLMASGLPTVAFDIGINRVFLDSLGIYAGEVSAEALGEAILRGMDRVDDGFRGRLRERALQHFSLQRLVGDMERVYARVAG